MNRFTGDIIIINLYSADALRASVEDGRKEIFCLHLSATFVHNLRNFLRKLY